MSYYQIRLPTLNSRFGHSFSALMLSQHAPFFPVEKNGAGWDSAPEFAGTLLLRQSTCDARGGITSSAQMGTDVAHNEVYKRAETQLCRTASMYFIIIIGSMFSPLILQVRCRCSPVDRPVFPVIPTASPALTA